MKQLFYTLTKKLAVEAPKDRVFDEACYIAKWGHWTVNGRGHVKGTIEGVIGVIVPCKKVHVIGSSTERSLKLMKTLDNGKDTLSDGQLEGKFNDIALQMALPAAVGVSFDDLMDEEIAASARPSSSREELHTPREKPANTERESFSEFGFGVQLHVVVLICLFVALLLFFRVSNLIVHVLGLFQEPVHLFLLLLGQWVVTGRVHTDDVVVRLHLPSVLLRGLVFQAMLVISLFFDS